LGFVPPVEASLQTTVAELAGSLRRSISFDKGWVIQKCPLCEVELRLHESRAGDVDELVQELFGFYDAHRCTAKPDEDMYQRAERASVQLGESALSLAKDPENVVLARRAERESLKLAAWVEAFVKRG
ncbi:MAG: hypothetical protein H0V17_13920, partial [Deltaproteobacteria bacterium]|nr:hypothetical protein [Deltaproteobacteria bacterium]